MVVTQAICNSFNFSNQEQATNHLIHSAHSQYSPYSLCKEVAPCARHRLIYEEKTNFEVIFFYFMYFCDSIACFVVQSCLICVYVEGC